MQLKKNRFKTDLNTVATQQLVWGDRPFGGSDKTCSINLWQRIKY